MKRKKNWKTGYDWFLFGWATPDEDDEHKSRNDNESKEKESTKAIGFFLSECEWKREFREEKKEGQSFLNVMNLYHFVEWLGCCLSKWTAKIFCY